MPHTICTYFLLLAVFFVRPATGHAQQDDEPFSKEPPFTNHIFSFAMGVGYESPKALVLEGGIAFSHFFGCRDNAMYYMFLRNSCGGIRLRHSYQFNYLPIQKASGFSTDINCTFIFLSLNLHGAYYVNKSGNIRTQISPMLGVDDGNFGIHIGPAFYLRNEWDSIKTAFAVSLKIYPGHLLLRKPLFKSGY